MPRYYCNKDNTIKDKYKGVYKQVSWCSTNNKPCMMRTSGNRCEYFPCLSLEKMPEYDYQI